MASKIEICNMALSGLGAKSSVASIEPVSGGTYESEYARQCALHYDQALRRALAEAPWRFASKRESLAQIADTAAVPSDWTYAFAYPSNCMRINRIVKAPRGSKPHAYETAYWNDQRIILCDLEEGVLNYVFYHTNTGQYPAHFVDTLVAALQAHLAMPLTRKLDIQEKMEKRYTNTRTQASAIDGNEQGDDDGLVHTAPWHEARK